MSGFENSILNNLNALIRAAVHSPNYSIGVSGWTINKDGSAEFNNLTIRGTFMGTNFVLNSSGIFFYDPTETLGNLVVSITAKVVTGPLGETVPAGLTIGKVADVQINILRDPSFATGLVKFLLNNASFTGGNIASAVITGPPAFGAMNLQGPVSTTVGFKDSMRQQFNSSDAVTSFANITTSYLDTTGATFLSQFIDGAGVHIPACAQLTATDPTTGVIGNPGVPETWHDLRPLSNSFVGTITNRYPPQYRKTADGDIEVVGYVQFPGVGTNFNTLTFANIAAQWRPGSNTGWKGYVDLETNVAPVGTPTVQVDSAGNLQFHNLPTSATLQNSIAGIYLRYPLDNTGVILS